MAAGSTHTLSEQELIALLKEKSEVALNMLYDNYSSALYGVIYRIVGKQELAEDVLQETFIKIWRTAASYDESKGKLFTWLVSIARNSAIDKVRSKEFRNERDARTIEDSNARYKVSGLANNPDLIGIKKLVEKLEPDEQIIINMMYFEGYTQSEVSEKLNIPLGTVKTRSRSAIKKLRQQFDFAIE
jgi:RNA polymerase sigma factor (sigma-70 family)